MSANQWGSSITQAIFNETQGGRSNVKPLILDLMPPTLPCFGHTKVPW